MFTTLASLDVLTDPELAVVDDLALADGGPADRTLERISRLAP